MAGLKLVIPTTFSNASLPYLRDDPILPKQGAMMLFDATHPASPMASGVPADQSYVPNIALNQLSSLIGSSADADAKLKMYLPATFTGTAGKFERTGKGGLHGISPQSGTAVAGSGPVLALSTKTMKYILDNKTHYFYASVWSKTTRSPSASYNNSSILAINGNGQQTNSFLFNFAPTPTTGATWAVRPASGQTYTLGLDEKYDATYGKFISAGIQGWRTNTTGLETSVPGDGTNASVTGSQAGGGLSWGSTYSWPGIGATGTVGNGTFNPSGNSVNKDKADSHIVYRFYLEDLTVSGRSFATVDAADYAEYTKQVLTATGRYYGDTFTDPTTVP